LFRWAPIDLMRMKHLRYVILFLLLIAAIQLLAADVATSTNPINVSANQSFSFGVDLVSATQIRGYSIRMAFDPLLNWWRVFTEEPGLIRVECIIFGAGLFVSGPGNLMTLSFDALSEGYTDFSFVSITLYDVEGQTIQGITSQDGQIIIGFGHAYASASCYLQGAFSAGGMTASLNEYLPLSSPYPLDPIQVSNMPADVVDWVLAELRVSPTGTALLSQAMWLHTDGSLTSPEKPFMLFMDTAAQDYFLAIKHRNHLPLISSVPVSFVNSGTPNTLDLSELPNIYDPATVTELSSGRFAMKAGEANGDGVINHSDRNQHWRMQAGRQGYLSADFNLDGKVFPDDLNAFWRPNSDSATNAIDPDPAGLDFLLAHPAIEEIGEDSYLSFELQLSADESDMRLGTGIILLEYDTAAFGSYVNDNSTVMATKGGLLTDGVFSAYNLIINDYAEDCLAITHEYWGNQDAGSLLLPSFQSLLRLSLPITAFEHFAGLEMLQPLMQDQQYRDDNSSLWNPVSTHPISSLYLPCAPTGLSLEAAEGNLQLSWDAMAERVYNIYSAASPDSEDWQLEASNLSTSSWAIPISHSSRFYRVKAKLNQPDF